MNEYILKYKQGDGKKQVKVLCCNQLHEGCWIVNIDSKTDINAENFNYEDIITMIEDECGKCDGFDYDCELCIENKTDFCKFPIISWDGGLIELINIKNEAKNNYRCRS